MLPGLNADYCFNIHTDSVGRVIGDVLLPKIDPKSYPKITKDEGITLVQKRWKANTKDINTQFAYHTKKKCFVWILSKPVENLRKSALPDIQVIVINAHNGRIIQNKMECVCLE